MLFRSVVADDLSPEQIKAFRLADNKVAELAYWNEEALAKELEEIADIDMSAFGFDGEEKAFLIRAAHRHNVFNYGNVAEYYAHASPEMQALMEESALVIIDVGNAIANGYATLMGEVLDAMEGDEGNGNAG